MDREYFKGLVVLVNLKVVISALKVATEQINRELHLIQN